MGIWVELEEGEPIADALRRFRKLINAAGGFPLGHYKWHKKRVDSYQKPSVYRRRKRWVARVKKRKRFGQACNPDPDYLWVDDLFMRPDRAWRETRSPTHDSRDSARRSGLA